MVRLKQTGFMKWLKVDVLEVKKKHIKKKKIQSHQEIQRAKNSEFSLKKTNGKWIEIGKSEKKIKNWRMSQKKRKLQQKNLGSNKRKEYKNIEKNG